MLYPTAGNRRFVRRRIYFEMSRQCGFKQKSTMPLFALKSVFKSDIIREGGKNGVYAPDAGYLDDVWFLTLLL